MFINGYVGVKDWWRVGLVASIANLLVWLTVGFAWWKLLGLW
jgi:DASS family divalent anion:Na+ symporter